MTGRVHCARSVKFAEQLVEDLEAVSRGGCDARVASGGGRMGVTMDRYEVHYCCSAAHPRVTVHRLAGPGSVSFLGLPA